MVALICFSSTASQHFLCRKLSDDRDHYDTLAIASFKVADLGGFSAVVPPAERTCQLSRFIVITWKRYSRTSQYREIDKTHGSDCISANE